MQVHLIDATYELFRQFYGAAKHRTPVPNAAAAGVVGSTLQLVADGATHLGLASDHVIESFRNELWPGYKTSAGMDPDLLSQIPVMEELAGLAGFTVWPMVRWEADDALGAAAAVADADPRVERVVIVTPDKDLGQCVRGERVVQYDRRNDVYLDEAAVTTKFGLPPSAIADYLALVGDSADGFPGLPGWGAKGASAVLARFGSLEAIPDRVAEWEGVAVRGAEKLCATLRAERANALLFKRIATVETDVPVGTVDEWRWRGPQEGFAARCGELGFPDLAARAERLAPG